MHEPDISDTAHNAYNHKGNPQQLTATNSTHNEPLIQGKTKGKRIVYHVLKLDECKGNKLFKIRNLHNYEWTGDWSPLSTV